MIKVMTIIGTRPEILRLSRIIPLFDQVFSHTLVHTGQNAQHSLRDIFFKELNLRAPDYGFSLPTHPPGAVLATLFTETEQAILAEKPDAILILGDTNSALSCLIANRHRIPVYHMEAGNRSFNRESPEEANRRVVDHSCDINLVYTEAARRNLIREGQQAKRIYLTGSPMAEVIAHELPRINASEILVKCAVEPKHYLLASLHRAEAVDHPHRLAGLIAGLDQLGADTGYKVLLSAHPRLQDRLKAAGITLSERIIACEPFGFHDWCQLQKNAACVISDSGTVSEEAAILQFGAITPRHAMERPEAMETGNVLLCGMDANALRDAAKLVMSLPGPARLPPEYTVPDVSRRVAALIGGTYQMVRDWAF